MKIANKILISMSVLLSAVAAQSQSRNDVIIISPIEVKTGRDADCITAWDKVAMMLREKPGFKAARLHRAFSDSTATKLITVATWSSYEQFEAAIADSQVKAAYATEGCQFSPSPYRPVRELKGGAGRALSLSDTNLNELYRDR
jgi:heme-degrading monooxygenase HmoA